MYTPRAEVLNDAHLTTEQTLLHPLCKHGRSDRGDVRDTCMRVVTRECVFHLSSTIDCDVLQHRMQFRDNIISRMVIISNRYVSRK